MTIQEFKELSKSNQHKTVSQDGRVLIDFMQGDKVIQVFKLDELFIILHMDGNRTLHLETLDDIENLKLYNH